MEELTSAQRRPSMRFGPDRRLTALAAAGIVVAIALALTTGDRPGRLIWALAAVVLTAYTVSDLMFAPRLAVDATGLRVRSPTARAELAWTQLDGVRADARTRYGLRSVTLEIDAGDTLIVLSRRALGAAPELVAETIRSFDPRERRP
ncbi:MAG: PH domain-containing protein [Actinomycetota bacterium]|nr:PH domain-containing protein [Actinomycetota bacterium]